MISVCPLLNGLISRIAIESLFWAHLSVTMHSISIAKKQYIAFLVLRYEFFIKPRRLHITFHSLVCVHIQIKAKKENRFLKEILIENPIIAEVFSKTEIDDLLNPHKYLGKAIGQTENLLKFLKNKHQL